MKNLTFKKLNNNGEEVILTVIATYHDDVLNKDFIIYTNKMKDDNGLLKVYCSLYKIVDNEIKLIDITTNEERKVELMLIKEIINN